MKPYKQQLKFIAAAFLLSLAGSSQAAYVYFSATNSGGVGAIYSVTPTGTANVLASGIDFNISHGLAVDASGNLYATSSDEGVINKITPGGVVTPFASGALLVVPNGLAFDSSGNLYVTNINGNTVSKITPGGVISPFASGFNEPEQMAFDSAGNLYVSNAGNNIVNKVTASGSVSAFASIPGSGFIDGMAIDGSGNLYVAEYATNGSIYQVTPGGAVSPYVTGLNEPKALAFDSTGALFSANFGDHTISKIISPGIASTSYTASGLFLNTLAINGAGPGNSVPSPEPSTLALFAFIGATLFARNRSRAATVLTK